MKFTEERLYQEALVGLRAPGFNKKEFFRVLIHTNPRLHERLKREGW